MSEQIESTGGERRGLINSLIVVSFCIAMLMLWPTYPLLAGIIFYTPTVIFLYCNRDKIIIVGKQWVKVFLGLGVLFFICKILAEKSMNYQFDIQTQYLNYSTFIYGFFLAALLYITIIFIRYFFVYLAKETWASIVNFFCIIPGIKRREKTQSLAYSFEPFILIGLLLPIVFVADFADKFTHYYLIADASPVSNCGEKIDHIWYIRKNDNQCYAINLERPLDPQFTVITSPNSK